MDEDERRLFYVALTRAKKGVTITYARENEEHKETLPSAFVGEIKPELVERINGSAWDERAKNDREFQFAPDETSKEVFSGKDQKAFVNELFEKQGLSPTALNNYLECPWKYFYVNLIRIPTTQSVHQFYGIAVHAALKDFFDMLKKEEVGTEYLVESFKGHLYRQPLGTRDTEELLQRGTEALTGWHDAYAGSWNLRTATEVRINGIELAEGVKITGVLDKVEYTDDNIVEVVDYKTAKPKSRNDLMGKTKGSDGNYYRQLVFYKLLLTHFKDGALSMQSGTIDFVEPNERRIYKKESFEITSDEVSELTDTILRVADEIRTLSFWGTRCDEKDCEFCRLRWLITK